MIFNPHKLGLHKVLQYLPLNKILFDRPFQAKLQKAVNIADLRWIAKQRAHKMVFDYLDGGADDEITLRRNKDAYSEIELHYKVLSGIQPPLDLSTTILGQKVNLPFFGCPTAGNQMFHIDGELGAALAAQHHGTLYCLSSLSTTSMQDIASATSTTSTSTSSSSSTLPKVFQLYMWKDRVLVKDLLQQAQEHGFAALALTVDVSWYGNRERDLYNGFSVPPNYSIQQTIEAMKKPAWTFDFLSHEPYKYACLNATVPAESLVTFVNRQLTPDFSWKDAEWVLGEWNTPHTAIKGVVRPEDAQIAVETGFSTIWISNHGGRQLETSPAPIDVLPRIRQAVPSNTEIIIDGGIQRGTDICKAIALGADGVGLGKPYLWGLCAGGKQGVIKAYDILKVELDRAMGLLGTPTIAALKEEGPNLVQHRRSSPRDFPDRYAFERGYNGGVI